MKHCLGTRRFKVIFLEIVTNLIVTNRQALGLVMVRLNKLYSKGRDKLRELNLYKECEEGVETGYVNKHNREIFQKYHLKMHGIDAQIANTTTSVLGLTLSSPIMMAPITSPIPQITEKAFLKISRAIKDFDSMVWVGFPVPNNLEDIAYIVPTGIMIKPYKDREKIFEIIDHAEDCGVAAYGIDFDSGARTKFCGNLRGPKTKPVTSEEIKKIKDSSNLPFILKGILSKKDAIKATNLDVQNFVITNHAAHTLDYLPHPLEVLPDLLEILEEKHQIFVDSGFRHGSDIFKGIAMGADIIMLGRPIIYGLAAEGEKGVKKVLRTITEELKRVMTMCGAKNVSEINKTAIFPCTHS